MNSEELLLESEVALMLVFLAIALGLAGVFMLVRDIRGMRERRRQERLPTPPEDPPLPQISFTPEREPRTPVGRFDRWFNQVIVDAGLRVDPPAAFLLAVLVGVTLGGIMFIWQEAMFSAIGGFLLGMVLTGAVYLFLRGRRMSKLREQLPDMMDLLARSTRSGQSLDQAIIVAGEMGLEPIAREFRRTSQQMEYGLSLPAAIKRLAKRVPLLEVRIFAATLMVQRRTGGSLPTTLERLAEAFRERLGFYRQFRSVTAVGRAAAIVILVVALLAGAYMFIFQPNFTDNFVTSVAGQAVLITAISLIFIGVVWLYRILRMEY